MDRDNIKEETKFWIHNPYVLLNKDTIFDLWPMADMTREEKLNAISKFVIYSTGIGFFLSGNVKLLFTGIITLVILIATYYILNKKQNNKLKEAFGDIQLYEKYKHNYTNPETINPLMNIQLPEIQQNPNRPPAAPSYNKAVEKQINDSAKEFIKHNFNDQSIDDKLFNDLGDKFEFEQSMRQFHTTANTTIPNNQKDFAQFCYGNMASYKDGDVDKSLLGNIKGKNM
jgi:hypothetical protein